MRHIQKQESKAYSKEKKRLTKTIPEEASISDLLDKNFKSTALNISKELKKIKDKE